MNSLDYLEYIKTKPCLVCSKKAEPHHLLNIGMGRDRKKPLREHYTAIPLCRADHIEIHSIGIKRFSVNLDVWKEAFNLLLEYYESNT